MTELDERTFKDFVKEGVVVIDFFAPWCGPCRALGPLFENWSERYVRAKFAKVNTEACPGLTGKFEINFLPTVVILRDGLEQKRIVGIPKEMDISNAVGGEHGTTV